ncbi:MAG: peptide-methionine (R)-S-oxide reductase [Proteobacteria bacterium]|nr:peptide-methionine (R)-S-oxide reductase [Pseudomonadota bacterium]
MSHSPSNWHKPIWPRSEYHCTRCNSHQSYIFDDGPQPTGKCYCNNGLALLSSPLTNPRPAKLTINRGNNTTSLH